MLNKFPLWKNIMLIAIIVLGFLYAAPNLYGDDPAVQVSGNKGDVQITPQQVQQVQAVLAKNNLTYKSLKASQNTMLIRFRDTDSQFKAQSLLKPLIGPNYTVAVNLAPAYPSWLHAIGAQPVKLGLDLRGGIQLLIEVDVQGVVSKRLDGMVKSISDNMRTESIRYISIIKNANNQMVLTFRDADMLNKAKVALPKYFADINFEQPKNNPLQLIGTPSPAFLQNVQQYAIEQTITKLRNRINELGIAEPVVQQQGANRISVDLPGVQDSARAKQILGATATVELHLVDKSTDVNTVLTSGIAPAGSKIYRMENGAPILLYSQVVLSGNSITSAASSFGEDGKPIVNVTLGGGGEAYFTSVTRQNIGNQLAIVFVETKTADVMVDGKPTKVHKRVERVLSAPVIQSALPNNFQITGINDPLEARNLALLLRAGAMPANVDIIQERVVGPSLGQENIHMGILSVIVAFILIVIFMALYYRLFGLFADLALALNLVLIVAILSILGATLTLPGIAGIVLTVGMAVDANVLIFERIREELRNGASPQAAIHAGFARAFGTIVDANVSTLIVAVVLFSVGTGPVQGFAVTLMIGILTSMFTAIMFTRGLTNLVYGGRPVKKLSIGMQ